MMGFGDGETLDNDQRHALGQLGLDQIGQRWTYVHFSTTAPLNAGEWVADRTVGEFTPRAAAIGDRKIELNGNANFVSAARGGTTKADLIGAYGFVNAGPGPGQGFVIQDVLEDDTIQITLMHDQENRYHDRVKGLTTALTTASRFRIITPGRVTQGPGSSASQPNAIRGVIQRDRATDDPEFGWVQQSGVGVCRLETTAGGDAVANDGLLYTSGSGVFVGKATADGTHVAQALFSTLGSAFDGDLVLADLRIENSASVLAGAPAARAVGGRGEPVR